MIRIVKPVSSHESSHIQLKRILFAISLLISITLLAQSFSPVQFVLNTVLDGCISGDGACREPLTRFLQQAW